MVSVPARRQQVAYGRELGLSARRAAVSPGCTTVVSLGVAIPAKKICRKSSTGIPCSIEMALKLGGAVP